MINLLPPEKASQIRYGRINNVLRRWLIGAGVAIAILMIIIASGVVYMDRQSGSLSNNITSTNKQLASDNLTGVQAQADALSGDVKVINQVLNREVRLSDLMQQIGKVMPSGAILGSLTLGNVTGAIDLTANTLDYPSAAQIATNLSDPGNNIFNKVDIVSISCQHSHPASPYACTATYRALFSKSASSNFVNPVKGNG